MKKRLLAILLSAFLLVGATVGCTAPTTDADAPEGGDTEQSEDTGDDTSDDDADSGEKITLSVWHGASGESAKFLEEEVFAGYMEANPNVEIKPVFVEAGDTTIQKLTAAASSDSLPQVLALAWPQYIGPLKSVIRTLDDFIDENPDQYNEDDFIDSLLDGNSRFNGVTYGVPIESNNLALFYNKDIFDAAGLTPPTTWEELVDVAGQLTDPAEKKWGINLPVEKGEGLSWVWQCFLWQAGGEIANEEGTELLYNSEAGVEALQFWVDMVNTDKVATTAPPENGFMSGFVAMDITGPWRIPTYSANEELNFGIAPLPAGPEGQATNIGGTVNLMFKGEEAVEQASWDLLMWMAAPEQAAEFAIGYGTVPIRKSSQDLDVWKTYMEDVPGMQVFIDQYTYGNYRPYQLTTYAEISTILSTHLEAAIFERETPEDALQLAYDEGMQVIETWLE